MAKITSRESYLSWLSKNISWSAMPHICNMLAGFPIRKLFLPPLRSFFLHGETKNNEKAKFPRSSVLVYIHKSIKTILAQKEKPDFTKLKCIPTTDNQNNHHINHDTKRQVKKESCHHWTIQGNLQKSKILESMADERALDRIDQCSLSRISHLQFSKTRFKWCRQQRCATEALWSYILFHVKQLWNLYVST